MSQAANTELDLESDLIVRKLEVTLLVDITVLYLEVTLLYYSTTVQYTVPGSDLTVLQHYSTVYCTWKPVHSLTPSPLKSFKRRLVSHFQDLLLHI